MFKQPLKILAPQFTTQVNGKTTGFITITLEFLKHIGKTQTTITAKDLQSILPEGTTIITTMVRVYPLTSKESKKEQNYNSEEADCCRNLRKGTKIYSVNWDNQQTWERDEGPKPTPEYFATVEYRQGTKLKLEGSDEFDFVDNTDFGYQFMTGELTTKTI